MSGGEIAALVAAFAFVVLVAVITVMLTRLSGTLTSVQTLVQDLHQTTVPVLTELRETVTTVNVEMERLDSIIASAESVASSASNVANLVSTAVSNPLIKAIAFLAGTGAAARALRKGRESS